jgi:hypothetical protein
MAARNITAEPRNFKAEESSSWSDPEVPHRAAPLIGANLASGHSPMINLSRIIQVELLRSSRNSGVRQSTKRPCLPVDCFVALLLAMTMAAVAHI